MEKWHRNSKNSNFYGWQISVTNATRICIILIKNIHLLRTQPASQINIHLENRCMHLCYSKWKQKKLNPLFVAAAAILIVLLLFNVFVKKAHSQSWKFQKGDLIFAWLDK